MGTEIHDVYVSQFPKVVFFTMELTSTEVYNCDVTQGAFVAAIVWSSVCVEIFSQLIWGKSTFMVIEKNWSYQYVLIIQEKV